jgi:hypothetical protein
MNDGAAGVCEIESDPSGVMTMPSGPELDPAPALILDVTMFLDASITYRLFRTSIA